MNNYIPVSADLDLSAGAVVIPRNTNGDEQMLINSFSLSVPSTLTLTVEYSIDGTNFTSLYSGLTNTERAKGGIMWRKMRFTRSGGSTNFISVNYAQGISGNNNSPDASTTADAESDSVTTRTGALAYSYNGHTWDRVRSGIVAAASTFLGWLNVLPGLRYNATPPTLTDGNVVVLQGDVNGLLKTREGYQAGAEDNTNGNFSVIEKLLAGVSTYSPSVFTNFGANATLNVKASAGNVYAIDCQNTNAAIRYIQLHNTTTTPAGGAVPLLSFAIPASSSRTITHDTLVAGGANFSTGIAFAFSTTLGTYTAGTAAEQSTTIIYK